MSPMNWLRRMFGTKMPAPKGFEAGVKDNEQRLLVCKECE